MYVIAIFLTDNNQQSNSPVCVALQHKDALCACRRAYKRKEWNMAFPLHWLWTTGDYTRN